MASTLTVVKYATGLTQYAIPFDYLARKFVVVSLRQSADLSVDQVLTPVDDYKFINATTIEVSASTTGYDTIQIKRFTGTDLVVDFRDGSVVTAANLTNSELQAIHIAEEGREQTLITVSEFVLAAQKYAESAASSASDAESAKDRVELLLSSGLYGYVLLSSFQSGATLTMPNHVLKDETTGEYYRWGGSLPKQVTSGSTPSSSGGIGPTAWVWVGDASLRSSLKSSASGNGADMVADSEFNTVRDVLKRIRTLSDYGYPAPHLGYNLSTDSVVYDSMPGTGTERHKFMRGGLHIADAPGNGIRRNASLLTIRSGQDDSGQGFNIPLMGVANARGLRNYGLYEIVPFYLDVSSPERKSFHTVATASYTATTALVDPDVYAETLANLSVGDYIRTQHSTYCVGIVTAVDTATGVITVDEWANSGTTTTTPSNGVGLYTRFITKIYAGNTNAFITENSDVNNAVIWEFAASAKKPFNGSFNGLDLVALPQTTQNLTAAFLSRSANGEGLGWTYGFRSQGAQNNFHSAGGSGYGRTIRNGFIEASDAIVGFRFMGGNAYSMLWSTSTDQTDVSLSNSPMIIGPAGSNYRDYNRLLTVSSDVSLSGTYPSITVVTAGITITMPPASIHRAGHRYTFKFSNSGTYYIAANNGDTIVNGFNTFTLTVATARKVVMIEYDGNYWQVWGI